MKNNYWIYGGRIYIELIRKDGLRLAAIISKVDFEKVNSYPNTWYSYYEEKTESFYVVGTLTVEGKKKTIQMHRWIVNAPEKMVVDHVNHNTLDNSRENLRVVSQRVNQQNRRGKQKNNKSGVRGVSWSKGMGKWRACIYKNKKQITVGHYDDISAAEIAIAKARSEHYEVS